MTDKLHSNFLESIDRYRACEDYWQMIVNSACAETCTLGQWHRYIPRFHPNGQLFVLKENELDGNPIFDGRSYATNRAFQIIQHLDIGIVGAWVEDYSVDYPRTWPVAELFISLCLTQESARVARELLVKWMNPECDITCMRKFIRELTGAEA